MKTLGLIYSTRISETCWTVRYDVEIGVLSLNMKSSFTAKIIFDSQGDLITGDILSSDILMFTKLDDYIEFLPQIDTFWIVNYKKKWSKQLNDWLRLYRRQKSSSVWIRKYKPLKLHYIWAKTPQRGVEPRKVGYSLNQWKSRFHQKFKMY